MNPERWQRLQAIFDAAVDLHPDQQAAFLDQACAGDLTLRREAESLMMARDDATRRIQGVIHDAAEDVVLDESASVVGQRIGPYQIIEELGRGGMGAVYLAVRADDEYRKRVAIKVVQHDLGNPEVLRRFRNERQILAGLDHAYIARLLDGGTTPSGMPYVVMEYVEGEPIGTYCEKRRLSIDERLKLFRKVCAAVHYAHQNLIVHRDIKPGNILVTAEGVPKLLDFGIAKLLNPELGPPTQAITRMALRLMTPEYASPEQIRGEPITTASDIYSLGVVLYELLTGHRPHHFKTYLSQEIEQVVSFEEPEKPSTIVARQTKDDGKETDKRELREREKRRRKLAGELDAIVMMALRKEPQRRYASADQFSSDIRRHLEGRPVRARPDTVSYRAGKFIRRHKAGVTAAALIVLTLIGGIVATAWQARIAHAERARAERRFNDVRKLANSFIFDVHDNIVDLPGSTRARESLVKNALEYLNSLNQEAGDDPALQRELAVAYQRVGDVQGNPTNANLGDFAGALTSYRKALEIAEGLVQTHPADREAQRTLALISQRFADLQSWTGDYDGAVQSARRSLALFKTFADAEATNLKARQSLAIAHVKLGDVLGNPMFPNAGDRVGALIQYEQSLALWESLHASDSADTTTRRYLGLIHERIGTMHHAGGKLADALASYQQSLVIRQSFAADHQTNTDARRDLAVAYEKVGDVLGLSGDTAASLEWSRKSLAIFEELSAADPDNANASRSLSVSYVHMGDVLLRSGDAAQALEQYKKSVAIGERMVSTGSLNVQLRSDLARAYARGGAALVALHRRQEARSWYHRSMNLWLNLRTRLLSADDTREADRVRDELDKLK